MGRDKEQNLKVVTAGIKVLERMANKGKGAKIEDDYRLVQVSVWYDTLYDVMLCYVMLCYVMLCYVMLCYAMRIIA